ncbi:MAG TPA: flagellar type III secretion system protein FliR [Firmicutes bacterium]|nr:flagellar type III secretion system protein FliR [Bacillota bacterium]
MLGLEGYLLAFIRFSTFIFAMPLLTRRGIPPQIKIGLAGFMAVLVAPPLTYTGDFSRYWIIMVIQEIGVGLLLAFAVTLIFASIQFSGQLVDFPIGFGMATVFDPQSGLQMPVFSQFYTLLATVIFFAVDAHLWILRALCQSYQYLPINGIFALDFTLEAFAQLGKNLFVIGFQIAAPIIGTILLVDVALGVVTRAVPQLNVFVLGFPIKNLLGLFVIILAIPVFVALVAKLFAYDGILMEIIYGLIQSGT